MVTPKNLTQRPKPQTKRQAAKQEKHIHKENMERMRNQRTKTQVKEQGKTSRTATRAAAFTAAVADGSRSAADVASKQIELQQLISGNRFSNNDATDEDRVSSGTQKGTGGSVTENNGYDILK